MASGSLEPFQRMPGRADPTHEITHKTRDKVAPCSYSLIPIRAAIRREA